MDSIESIMTKKVECIKSSQTVFEATKIMKSKGIGCLVVIDDGNALGIITERDIVRRVVAENVNANEVKVSVVMSKPLITMPPKSNIREAARIMIKNKIRRLPVAENSKLLGIITSTDLTKYLMKRRRTLGSLISLDKMPKAMENSPSCQFFKQDPYVSPTQVWKICGACYWQMDEKCLKGAMNFLKGIEQPIDN